MASDAIFAEQGLNLLELAHVRTHKGPIHTSEALDSQLSYIEETRKAHGYSRAVDRLFDLVLSYVYDHEASWREGKNVIWTSAPLFPVFYANDVLPIPISELGRLGSADALTAAEDTFHLPEGVVLHGGVDPRRVLPAVRPVPRPVSWSTTGNASR